jgi:hypothetical protein
MVKTSCRSGVVNAKYHRYVAVALTLNPRQAKIYHISIGRKCQ